MQDMNSAGGEDATEPKQRDTDSPGDDQEDLASPLKLRRLRTLSKVLAPSPGNAV